MVLLVHASEFIYSHEMVAHLTADQWASTLFAHLTFTLGRLGVPLFLFLTGYLLLDRDFGAEGACRRFWRRNWLGIVLATEIWMVLYAVFLWAIKEQHWNGSRLLREMLFLSHQHMPHTWYLPMIIGLYLFLPIMAQGLRHVGLRALRFPLIALCLYAFGVPLLQVILDMFSTKDVEIALDLGFSGGTYGLYVILGFCVKRGLLANLAKWQLATGFVVFLALTALLQWVAHWRGADYYVWYDNGLLVLASLFLFGLLSRLRLPGPVSCWGWLSRHSFGIYLVHMPFMILLYFSIRGWPLAPSLQVALLYGLALLASVAICCALGRAPAVARAVLYDR